MLGTGQPGEPGGVIGLGRARDLLHPPHHRGGVVEGDRDRPLAVERSIERRDQVVEPLVGFDHAGGELDHAPGDIDERLERIGERVDHPFDGFGHRHRPPPRVEHEEQIDAQDTPGALDDDLALHRLDIPRQLELSQAVTAAHHRPPLVEAQVGIAALGLPYRAHPFDRPEEGLKQVEGVHAEVPKGIRGRAVLRGQGPAAVGRIHRSSQDVDGDDLPELARAHQLEPADNLGIEQQGVVDRGRPTGATSRRLDAEAVRHAGGERLLHQHIAAEAERGDGDVGVVVGWSQNVDRVRAGLAQRRQRGVALRAQPLGQRLGSLRQAVGHADQIDLRQAP